MKDYRHGDIYFKAIEKLPQTKEGENLKEHIVAHGEVTGHHHKLTGDLNIMIGFDDKKYIEIKNSIATLTHQEHSTLSIEPGCYEIITEREWDYFENETRRVVD